MYILIPLRQPFAGKSPNKSNKYRWRVVVVEARKEDSLTGLINNLGFEIHRLVF